MPYHHGGETIHREPSHVHRGNHQHGTKRVTVNDSDRRFESAIKRPPWREHAKERLAPNHQSRIFSVMGVFSRSCTFGKGRLEGTIGRDPSLRSLSIVIGAPPPPIIIVQPQLRAWGIQSGPLFFHDIVPLSLFFPLFSSFSFLSHSIIRLYYCNAATSMSGASEMAAIIGTDARYPAFTSQHPVRAIIVPRPGILLKF